MSTYSGVVLATTGLVSYWQLKESAGTSAADSKGTNSGTYQGGFTFGQTGIPGESPDKATLFDGSTGYVSTTTNIASPGPVGPFTLECWFKTTSSSGTALLAFADTQTGSAVSCDREVYVGTDGKVYFVIYNGGFISVSSAATYNDGNWHHAVAVLAANNNMTLYVDDVSASNANTSAPQVYGGYWRLGRGQTDGTAPNFGSAGQRFLNGTLAQVAVYNAALSAATVLDHYQAGTLTGPYTPAPPIASTDPATSVSATGATLNGTVNPNGKSTTAQFEWGTTTGYGNTVSLGTVGSDSVAHSLSTVLSGLTTGQTYHYRITATNADGTTNGADQQFTPAQAAFREPAPRAGVWEFVCCDGSGNALTALTRHQGTSATFTRNDVPSCTFSLSHDDDECATILTALKNGTGNGMPTLKGFRMGRDGTKVLRFNGYLATISEESGTDASTATFTFRGPFGRYVGDGGGRGELINAVSYTDTDAGLIAKDILDQANVNITQFPGSVIPMDTAGTIELSKKRDRTYPSYTNAGEAVLALTSVLDGFDFEVLPIEGGATLGRFYVYAQMGQDRPAAKFEYGPNTLANCSAMHRQTLPPINLSTVVGSGNVIAITPARWDLASIAKYGQWRHTLFQSDVSDRATLDDKAVALKRPDPIRTIDFTPDPRLAPLPWDDYWIGDRVQFYANRGALVEGPLSVRVNQITVVIDPDTGLESAEIPDPLTGDEERTIRASLQTEVVA